MDHLVYGIFVGNSHGRSEVRNRVSGGVANNKLILLDGEQIVGRFRVLRRSNNAARSVQCFLYCSQRRMGSFGLIFASDDAYAAAEFDLPPVQAYSLMSGFDRGRRRLVHDPCFAGDRVGFGNFDDRNSCFGVGKLCLIRWVNSELCPLCDALSQTRAN